MIRCEGPPAPRCRSWALRALVLATVLLVASVPALAQGAPSGAAPATGGEAGSADEPLSGDYRIGVEDVLTIHVWEDESLGGGIAVTVRPDGWITFPYVENEIRAAGMTPIELRDEIREGLRSTCPTPR